MRLLYRVRQFFQALTAAPTPHDLEKVKDVLSPNLFNLFLKMQTSEQAHSIRVYKLLLEQGETNQDLLTAALLHDVGKSRYPLRLWERVFIVLGKAISPQRLNEWGQAEAFGWRRPFVVSANHAEWGAEMAKNAGASTTTIDLIKRHQTDIKPNFVLHPSLEDELLLRLQILDNES